MTTEKMTVYRALCELKLLDSRITRAILQCDGCTDTASKQDKYVGGLPREKFNQEANDAFKSAFDLITRRNAIKRAVVLSNATTMITVLDRTMTVAEAIEVKTNGQLYLNKLTRTMEESYASSKRDADRANSDIEKRAESFLTNVYGSDKSNIPPEDLAAAKQSYIDTHTKIVVDPANFKEKSEAFQKEMDLFEASFDAALSVSNATTEITVTY